MIQGVCEDCHLLGNIHVHHKDRDHSNDAQDNRQSLCPSCHRLEHMKDKELTPYLNVRKEARLPSGYVLMQYQRCHPRA